MTELLLGLTTILVVAILNHVQALRTRPELFFAVTVPADFRPSSHARRILYSYAVGGWAGTMVCVALLATERVSGAAATLATVVVWLIAFFLARRAALPFASKPTAVREASLNVEDYAHIPGALAMACGPALIFAVKAVWVYLHWNDVADRIPVHWGFQGPDRWVERSPSAVFGMLATLGVISLMMTFSGYATLFRSGPASEEERKKRKIGFLGLLVLGYLIALALPPVEGVLPTVPFAPVLLVAASLGIVVALLYSGAGGAQTADDCWKLGMFYYNPDDLACIVEKRFGVGWTWNFGSPWSWILVPAVLLSMLLPLLLR